MRKVVKGLKDILERELHLYNNILDLSEKKTEIIKSGKVKELEKTTQIEQKLIYQAGRLEEEREEIIEKLRKEFGLKKDIDMTKLLEHLDKNEKGIIEKIRNELLDTLEKLKERNNLNGRLIQDSLEYINFNLNLLTNASKQTTYSNEVKKGDQPQNKNLFDAKV
ncbi:flagellar protein FlgN [Thermohalobacter berrensis]|uniref:Flagellar biosynthesis protein FlgN n=1 Tax=Thermohalobacter berrensis TaxID=99594 RepID=A0A419T440_9FIRM|nr:flagellar protein FlgN [Thermohalobacter berrensis]RKD32327.1 hypothetical protein BET03_03190 [Thermohalobacter berrensis]